MQVDKKYCMNSFLMYRVVIDPEKCFAEGVVPNYLPMPSPREEIHNSEDLYNSLKRQMEEYTAGKKKCAIALSGGIDSAILLQFMPDNSLAYTFKCEVPGVEVTDESPQAKVYLEKAQVKGIEHKIVSITWEDMMEYTPLLMKRKGAPIHSIEVQIYKAALQAKADGCDCFIFGDTADCVYGGHSKLLSKDWTYGEFIDRWSFVLPYKVLKDYEMDMKPYDDYVKDGYIDVLPFLSIFEAPCSLNSYRNACGLAGIEIFAPYAHTIYAEELDLERVRQGENKYVVREVFARLYPGLEIPPKTPMPRPMNIWLGDWEGPTREEFIPHCTDEMTADQKWLVWSLERFLNLIDER